MTDKLDNKVEPGCVSCAAALLCVSFERPTHRMRCQRCGTMAVYVHTHPTSVDIPVTVHCPIKELTAGPEYSEDVLLCNACLKFLKQCGGRSRWKADGRPKTKDFATNVARSLSAPHT